MVSMNYSFVFVALAALLLALALCSRAADLRQARQGYAGHDPAETQKLALETDSFYGLPPNPNPPNLAEDVLFTTGDFVTNIVKANTGLDGS